MNRPAAIPQHIWDTLTDDARTTIGATIDVFRPGGRITSGGDLVIDATNQGFLGAAVADPPDRIDCRSRLNVEGGKPLAGRGVGKLAPIYEVAFNHYPGRRTLTMPFRGRS
jgi:hypothetical protein